MKKLCDYGCGRESKYQLKNGKWCCSKSHNSCSINKEKNRLSLNRPEVKIKHRKTAKKVHNRPEIKEKHSKVAKKAWNNPGLRAEQSKSHRLTIEQIQEKYQTFAKEEEMRYNPDEPEEKEIQVHCKYNKCEHSKESGGWFTPTYIQLYERVRQLEKDYGNGGSYFYCLDECKQRCCLFRLISDPIILSKFKKYSVKVWKETNKTLKKHFDKIKNIELRGYKHKYALDHKYTIYDGFINNTNPEIIGHWKNLECIPESENNKKNRNSSITLEELLKEIK